MTCKFCNKARAALRRLGIPIQPIQPKVPPQLWDVKIYDKPKQIKSDK